MVEMELDRHILGHAAFPYPEALEGQRTQTEGRVFGFRERDAIGVAYDPRNLAALVAAMGYQCQRSGSEQSSLTGPPSLPISQTLAREFSVRWALG